MGWRRTIRKFFASLRQSAPPDCAVTAEPYAQRLLDIVNESLLIATQTSDLGVRHGRLQLVRKKLPELVSYSGKHPEITTAWLNDVLAQARELEGASQAVVFFTAEDLLKRKEALAELDGTPTHKLAGHKHDLEIMEACMRAEIENYWRQPEGHRLAAAPFFFERTAILQRKAKNYSAEVAACESWIEIVDNYKNQGFVKNGVGAKVWLGATSRRIMGRLPRARELHEGWRRNS